MQHFCKPSDIGPRLVPGLEQFGRLHDPHLDKLTASIAESGIHWPILVDRDMNLISGWRRLEAAKKVGETKVPFLAGDIDTIIAAMDAENAHADPATTVPMQTLEKMYIAALLRELGRPRMLDGRMKAARMARLPPSKRPPPGALAFSVEPDIARVLGFSASAWSQIGVLVPAVTGVERTGAYQAYLMHDREKALKAVEEIDNGGKPHRAIRNYRNSLREPIQPQPLAMWKNTVEGMSTGISNLGVAVEGLRIAAPPADLTPEQAAKWAEQLTDALRPARALLNRLYMYAKREEQ